MIDLLLIHPPIAKPSEPPAGLAKLFGVIQLYGKTCSILDANLEGLLNLLSILPPSSDTWTSRALRHLPQHLHALRSWEGYKNGEGYRRSIKDLNRLLSRIAQPSRVRLSLTNYEHEDLSPVRSEDLIKASDRPQDNPFYPYFKRRLTQLIEEKSPSLVGFSLNYLSQALCTFAMIGFLKRKWPKIRLVLGGGLITSWMRRPQWKNPFGVLVDHLVDGPGEVPLLRLMGVEEPERISSLPRYDSFPLKEYFAPDVILPYNASTGCYWNRCSFCPEKAEGNIYQATTTNTIIEDLQYLVLKHQPVLIHLLDNALSPSLLEVMVKHPSGAPWYGFARLTTHLTDLDFCRALKQSGCVMLKLGLESGDPKVLEALQKGIDLGEASLALKMLKRAGIATYLYLLFGTPQEGLEEARKTLQFVASHSQEIDFLNLAIFNMPIHGPEVSQLENKPFYEGDLSLYTSFSHPKGWNRAMIRRFLEKEFKKHPAIAPIVRRDPPAFTSNHAPFFVKNRGIQLCFSRQKGNRF